MHLDSTGKIYLLLLLYRKKVGHTDVTVTTTPDGYADAVTGGKFVKPAEKLMNLGQFLDILEGKKQMSGVAYIQKQNSNFMDEFSSLAADVEMNIEWATDAFGD